MPRRIFLFCLVVLVFTFVGRLKAEAPLAPTPGLHTRKVRIAGRTSDLSYRLFVPKAAADLDLIPVVLLLPNVMGKPVDLSPKSGWVKRAEASGFLVVALDRDGGEAARAILADVEKAVKVDAARVFVVGANVLPEKSAAVALDGITVSVIPTYQGTLEPEKVWAFFERHPKMKERPVATRLTVTVTGLRGERGRVLIALFDRAEGFPNGEKAAFSATAEISEGRARATFPKLPPSDYAAVVLHDENSDGKMDTSFGFPLEGFGATNGAATLFGPPKWAAARFYLAGDRPEKQIVVPMLYPGPEAR